LGSEAKRLVILHTNDIHSSFESMPKLATLIGRYRRHYPSNELLVVDCGDHLDRVRIETEGTQGIANIEVMNATGYEVFVPGNNEGLTFPKATIESVFREHAQFTVLGTNMYDLQTGLHPSWISDHCLIEKNGIKIGIIGVTASYKDFYEPLGWEIRDPMETVKEATEKLRPSVDFLLVISHVGLQFDRLLAEEVIGIDYIVGGHTHHLFEEAELVGQTRIGAAGKLGAYLGVIEIEFDSKDSQSEGQALRIKSLTGRALPASEEADDPQIVAIIEKNLQRSRKAMDRQVARLLAPIHHHPLEESELGNLLADGIRRWTNSEIGIVNSGQLLSGLSAGCPTEADMLAICPSPVNPCSIQLSGEYIMQALEESLLTEFTQRIIRGFGFRGKQLGVLCLSGIDVIYEPAAPAYEKIKQITIGNQPIDRARLYKVGTIDMFTFGIGYLSLSHGQDIHYYIPEFIRDILKHELSNPLSIRSAKYQHWRTPEL
jgi:5'-nucleotidase